SHLEERRVVERTGLATYRLDDLRPAMPRVHAPQPGGAVEDLTPVLGRIVHVLRRHEYTRRGLELAVRGKRQPVSVEIVVALVHGRTGEGDGTGRSIVPRIPVLHAGERRSLAPW